MIPLSGWRQNDVKLSYSYPIMQNLEASFSAGVSQVETRSWSPTFSLISVTTDSNGNILGTYGQRGGRSRIDTMFGYNGGFILRYYLK